MSFIGTALSRLRFHKQRPSHVPETRGGASVFNGDPALFYERERRARVKTDSLVKDEYIPNAAGKVIEGVLGDALEFAVGVGWEAFQAKAGVPSLIERIKIVETFVFPSAIAEAKELYLLGHREE